MPKKIVQLGYQRLIKLISLVVICTMIGGASFASPSSEGIQIYQKNLHLSPEHRQKLTNYITPYLKSNKLSALR